MKLLYRTAEWHALAKLRMHTDSSLMLLDKLSIEFGQLLRQFRELTCTKFATLELPREVATRNRRRKSGQMTAQENFTRNYVFFRFMISSSTAFQKVLVAEKQKF